MKVVYTPAHLRHDPKREWEGSIVVSAWEHIGRGEAIRETLQADPRFQFMAPTEWGTAPIEAVHNPGLVRFIDEGWAQYKAHVPEVTEVVPFLYSRNVLRDKMSEGREPQHIFARAGYWCFETTTPLTEGTHEAARGAVDTALTTTQLVLDGERAAYGLCRPPGHHATSDMYGGYCFFNNAAIAAHHVASTRGVKVTVLDVDYHHGNGTQQIFYDRDDVQYVSLHGDPRRAYPYVLGFRDETGTGRGLGHTVNYPMPLRADDDAYTAALSDACEKVAAFRPDLLIVSLGVDTFITDPISDLAVTTEGMGRCGAIVRQLGLPTVVLQEGGYDVNALGANVQSWLVGLGA